MEPFPTVELWPSLHTCRQTFDLSGLTAPRLDSRPLCPLRALQASDLWGQRQGLHPGPKGRAFFRFLSSTALLSPGTWGHCAFCHISVHVLSSWVSQCPSEPATCRGPSPKGTVRPYRSSRPSARCLPSRCRAEGMHRTTRTRDCVVALGSAGLVLSWGTRYRQEEPPLSPFSHPP